MTQQEISSRMSTGKPRVPVGAILERVPAALYAAAHVAFLALALWAMTTARAAGSPTWASLGLYALSQVGFLAYFAHFITMKAAVLTEQMAVAALVILVVVGTTR